MPFSVLPLHLSYHSDPFFSFAYPQVAINSIPLRHNQFSALAHLCESFLSGSNAIASDQLPRIRIRATPSQFIASPMRHRQIRSFASDCQTFAKIIFAFPWLFMLSNQSLPIAIHLLSIPLQLGFEKRPSIPLPFHPAPKPLTSSPFLCILWLT